MTRTLLLLAVIVIGLMSLGSHTINKHGLAIEGELQHQWTTPPTFWVDGFRFSVDDRPETQRWLEDQVGKQIEITIK